jgi:purine-cytosine permease-like protein
MSTAKKKRPTMARAKQQDQVNKKALIWFGAIFGAIVLAVGILLVLNV